MAIRHLSFPVRHEQGVVDFCMLSGIVDRLTNSAHFLPMKTIDSQDTLSRLYIKEITKSHGISVSIIFDMDPGHFLVPEEFIDVTT